MAGRNRVPRHRAGFSDFHGGGHPHPDRGFHPLPIHPAALEEEIKVQRGEICRILDDNHQLVDENTMLKRDVVAAREEINRLGQVLGKLHADKDSQSADLINKCLKMEADLSVVAPLREEAIRLRAEAQKLNAMRKDLTVQIQGLTQDITHLRSDNKRLNTLNADIDRLRKELAESRRSLELEKKANEEQMIQNQIMEKNLISMTLEVQKLRAEQCSFDRGALGYGVSSYGTYKESPDMRHSNSASIYGDVYGRHWSQFNNQGPPRQ